MNALCMIAKNNIKKKKGDVSVLMVLIALAALLIFASISILVGATRVMQAAYEHCNTADYFYYASAEDENIVWETLQEQEGVVKKEKEPFIITVTKFRKALEDEASEYTFYVGNFEKERSISKIMDVDLKNLSADSVLLPYYMHSTYEIGDTFYITLGETEYKFIVGDFYEDPMMATPLNCTVYEIYISENRFEQVTAEEESLKAQLVTRISTKLEAGMDSAEFENTMRLALQEKANIDAAGVVTNWKDMSVGGCMMAYIGMAIILLFSTMLIIVVLVIVRYSIRNFLESNIKNIGILEAQGYTIKELRISTMLEMGIISFSAAVLGVVLGCVGQNVIGKIVAMLLGLRWNQPINVKVAILVVTFLLFSIEMVAFLTSSQLKRYAVLDLLRTGIRGHNFKKNVFPIEKSKLHLPVVLSLKDIFGEKKKQISVLVITAVLAVVMCITCTLFENFAANSKALIDLVGIEVTDAALSSADVKSLGKDLEQWNQVEKVLYHADGAFNFTSNSTEASIQADIWDNPSALENDLIIEGRAPSYDNEVMLSIKAAELLGVELGDVVMIDGAKGSFEFVVVGIDEKINYLGKKATLSTKAAERINGGANITQLCVNLAEGYEYEEFQEDIQKKYSDVEVANYKQIMLETMYTISQTIFLICIIFLVIVVLVVVFVEVLLIRSKIIREKKSLGIQKALGYTSAQLMLQTAFFNIPVVMAGSILGITITKLFGSDIASSCMAICGISKMDLPMPFYWMLVTFLILTVIAFLASLLVSLRIRKIEPVSLLMEE